MKRLIYCLAGLGVPGLVYIAAIMAGWLFPVGAQTVAQKPVLRGVDVAHYQGQIDWAALADHDISFAFIKATEGGDWVDPRFYENWQSAKRVGLRRGAYHFFTLCRDAHEQAEHFLETVGDMKDALMPALDAEHMGPCQESAPISDVAGGVLSFLDMVHIATGKRPVIYTTEAFYSAHLAGRTPGERYWLRSILREPGYGPDSWVFWQYSGNGRRRGIRGPVDLNIFRGDSADLDRLVGYSSPER